MVVASAGAVFSSKMKGSRRSAEPAKRKDMCKLRQYLNPLSDAQRVAVPSPRPEHIFLCTNRPCQTNLRQLPDPPPRSSSPSIFSPPAGTDWDLAAGLAASPGGAALYQDDGPAGRRRSRMVNPASGVVPDRKARRASRRRGEGNGGGQGSDGDRPPPPPAADRSFLPPVSRSSSGLQEQGGSSGVRRTNTPARTRVPFAQGQRVGSAAGDSDCDTAVPPEGVTPMGGDVGGWGVGAAAAAGAGAGAPRTPRAYLDSDGGSRYYGSSGGEDPVTHGVGGGGRMPPPSPLMMVHHRGGKGGTDE